MENTNHAVGVALLVGLLSLATGSVGFAAGPGPESTGAPPGPDPPATTSTSPSYSLGVLVASSTGRATSCSAGRALVAEGPSLLTKAVYTPLADECLTCCAEYIFIDGFESGNTTNWSAVVGG